jgi:23S rRNA (guanosine2251-2'-O)-methyltransferase
MRFGFTGLMIACFQSVIVEGLIIMSKSTWVYQCLRPGCRFRFTRQDQEIPTPLDCPKCGSPTRSYLSPYHDLTVQNSKKNEQSIQIEILMDNIRSALNVGSIFRTSDGAGVSHIYICGITPTPDNPKIAKSALGSQFAVPWSQHWDAVEVCERAKSEGKLIWVLEGGEEATSLYSAANELPRLPILLVIGSEVTGVDPHILALSDKVICIPMYGSKGSLNVSVAYGIAVYTILHWHS